MHVYIDSRIDLIRQLSLHRLSHQRNISKDIHSCQVTLMSTFKSREIKKNDTIHHLGLHAVSAKLLK